MADIPGFDAAVTAMHRAGEDHLFQSQIKAGQRRGAAGCTCGATFTWESRGQEFGVHRRRARTAAAARVFAQAWADELANKERLPFAVQRQTRLMDVAWLRSIGGEG